MHVTRKRFRANLSGFDRAEHEVLRIHLFVVVVVILVVTSNEFFNYSCSSSGRLHLRRRRRRRLCRIKSKVQQEHQKTEQQTTNVFPRLSFLIRGGFCHEPRRLVSSLLLFEQEQVPLVQCRHLSRGGALSLQFALLFFFSLSSSLLNAFTTRTRRGREKRMTPLHALALCVRARARAYLFLRVSFGKKREENRVRQRKIFQRR